MRYLWAAAGLAALSAGAKAQDQNWQIYEAEGQPAQAFVQGVDGSQLILKCDKPGKRSVYAVVVAKETLAIGTPGKFEIRPVKIRVDNGTTMEDSWRFNGEFATAVDDRTQKAMTKLAEKLAGASNLSIMLERYRQAPVEAKFQVAGADAALAKVYESCGDDNPVD